MSSAEFDESFDVIVVGSGGGALTGAFFAASLGLRTLVVESTDRFGGTTAYSGAGLWLPGNAALERGGVIEPLDDARAYLRAVIGNETASLQDAFLESGAPMIAELERNEHLCFEHRPFPDYYPSAPHMRPLGRDIFPLDLPRSDLGALAEQLRPALPQDRGGMPAPDVLTGGQALVGRLLRALSSLDCTLRTGCALDRLIVDDDGTVVAIEVLAEDTRRTIAARRGVLLAAGGFERNDVMRKRFGVQGSAEWSTGAPGGTGRAIEAGIEIGAAAGLMDECWWTPGVVHPDGSSTFTLGVHGGVFVNGAGQRFANESLPYDQMGRAVIAGQATGISHLPFWFVFDDRFAPAMPAMSTLPVERDDLVAAGLWRSASTLAELAAAIDLPGEALAATVSRFNGFAMTGIDEEFHRGEAPYDAFFAAGEGPNKALVPIDRSPYHAVRFTLSDLGTKGGLATDEDARVRRTDGSIPACTRPATRCRR